MVVVGGGLLLKLRTPVLRTCPRKVTLWEEIWAFYGDILWSQETEDLCSGLVSGFLQGTANKEAIYVL